MAESAAAACASLRATAELLRLPNQAVATAAVFFHRYRASSSEFGIAPDVMSTPDLRASVVKTAKEAEKGFLWCAFLRVARD